MLKRKGPAAKKQQGQNWKKITFVR